MEIQYQDLRAGQALPVLKKPPITKVQLVKYAGASGDFNPLHTDDEFAQKIGMNGVIAHGMLIMGFLGQYIMELAGTTAEIKQFKMRFGAMTIPGDLITCSSTVEKIYEEDGLRMADLNLIAEKESGSVVGSGKATLKFR
ncbi:dehydratase [Pradoshia sp. D12]|uniref:MaoC/PaaZ C-terminal domain-containing protein n=1 Tax=Bacillaceae TaxID=186817 RepID=UPI00080ADAE5|nr:MULTISPECIES: MaoC/PaaZ C-terminal domain-containing protein [Bacillaceae]OCA86804.1 dehydratase [Bacillus sp. FJAT-27986]QFK71427.1 dehydratase [Pradoshia sp. D12]TPF73222.1 dehydratase [Bacillus sp. D12]